MSANLRIATAQGIVEGSQSNGCLVWRGLPYAAPPVGPLRWKAPTPPQPWTGVRDAAQNPPEAMQPSKASASMSEDCLYLSVCAPTGDTPDGGWPVLFWVHGGGDMTGNSEQLGIGDVFAREGILVVEIQYRLGSFGFLNLGEVFGSAEVDSGSCGMLDQIAALRWTSENIAAFGGNPERITIYGESAGAKGIGDLLGSPMAVGLFAQAISSSGGADDVATSDATTEVARVFLKTLGNPDIDALRALSAEDVLKAESATMPPNQSVWIWRPTMHAQASPQLPIDSITAGNAKGVRCIIGNNGNEAAYFAQAMGFDNLIGPARANLVSILGEDQAEKLLAQYKAGRGVDDSHALVAGTGDERYAIGTLREADAQSVHGTVFRYRLDVAAPGMPEVIAGGHTNDLYMVWQTPNSVSALPADDPRQKLSKAMHEAWVAFIKTGTPAAAGLPEWPEYNTTDRATMILQDTPAVELDPRKEEREIWGDTTWTYGTWWPLPSS